MATAQTYIRDIRAQVKADHGGLVPKHLMLTIRNYANALAMRDTLQEKITKEGPTITEVGSMGQMVTRQHPILSNLYQYETLIQKYAKDLGGTSAKAAAKPESQGNREAGNKLDEFLDATMG